MHCVHCTDVVGTYNVEKQKLPTSSERKIHEALHSALKIEKIVV